MRECVRCKETKPESDFNPSKPRTCKTCWRATQKAYRERTKARPKQVPTWKVCPQCCLKKPSGEFWRNNARPDGLMQFCKACWSGRSLAYVRGLTAEQVDAMLVEQGGACAICRTSFTETPHLDHDHSCCPPGRACVDCARGLLCRGCNTGLGSFQDDPTYLRAAIDYLAR